MYVCNTYLHVDTQDGYGELLFHDTDISNYVFSVEVGL